MRERSEFELLTGPELRKVIATPIEGSALDEADFIELSRGAKRGLMTRWAASRTLSKLDLQRVLRVVRELDAKHGGDANGDTEKAERRPP